MENSNVLNYTVVPEKKPRYTAIGFTKFLKGIRKPHLTWCDGEVYSKLASKTWKISPGNTTYVPKAYYLDGQLDRITGTAFTDDPITMMKGGYTIKHAPTRAFMLKDVWMINGSLYKGVHQFKLHPTSQYEKPSQILPKIKVETEISRAAIYSSYPTHQYFGSWLIVDCNLYLLAATEGLPVTSNIYASPHMLEYESLLGMQPHRTNSAFLKEAIFFDDEFGHNENKHERFSKQRDKLISLFPRKSHPGVFILRRDSGQARIMKNEVEIAEQLEKKYGFQIVDVTKHSVKEILSACVGAKVLVGVEGSHLMHGLMVLEPGTTFLALQPPNRFCGSIRMVVDMQEINFSFVIGTPSEEGFYINMEEIERTIDLLPST
ncbi:hypothetical protein MHTCC0001_26010 [Flavobacteriaceae bacterium MHTCC 0001]